MVERYANNSASTLAGGIDSSVTSLDVADASTFPATGQFRIRIDSELLLVTAVSSNTFTVSRGSEGTTPASHSNGAAVNGTLTAGALDQIRADISTKAAWASRSAASKEGRLFFPTDGFMLSRDNGSAWESYGPLYHLTEFDDTGFAWVNQGSATITFTNGGAVVYTPINSNVLNCRFKSQPSKPYTVTAHVRINTLTPNSTSWAFGLAWRKSGDGKIITAYFNGGPSTIFFTVDKWNSASAYSATYTAISLLYSPLNDFWIRIADDNTNRKVSISTDGQNFLEVHSVGNSDFGVMDQVGFTITSSASWPTYATIHDWRQA